MKDDIETGFIENATRPLADIVQNIYHNAVGMGFSVLNYCIPNLFLFQSSLGSLPYVGVYREDSSSIDVHEDLTERANLPQKKNNRAVDEMKEKQALLTAALDRLDEALKKAILLGILGPVQSGNVERAIKSKIDEIETIITDNMRDKEQSENLLKTGLERKTKLIEKGEKLLSLKESEEFKYNESIQDLTVNHRILIQNARQEALQAGQFAKSFRGRFLDLLIFIPKTIAGLFGATIKTNLDIYNEKNEAYSKLFFSEPDLSSVTKPDFTLRENELTMSISDVQQSIHEQRNKISTLDTVIKNARDKIASLTEVLTDIKSLQEEIFFTQEDVNSSIERADADDNSLSDDTDSEQRSVDSDNTSSVEEKNKKEDSSSYMRNSILKRRPGAAAIDTDDEDEDDDEEVTLDSESENQQRVINTALTGDEKSEQSIDLIVGLVPKQLKDNVIYLQFTEKSIHFLRKNEDTVIVSRDELSRKFNLPDNPSTATVANKSGVTEKNRVFFTANLSVITSIIDQKEQEMLIEKKKADEEKIKKQAEVNAAPQLEEGELLRALFNKAVNKPTTHNQPAPSSPAKDMGGSEQSAQVKKQMQDARVRLLARDISESGCTFLKLSSEADLNATAKMSDLVKGRSAVIFVDNKLFFVSKGLGKVDGVLGTVFKKQEIISPVEHENSYNSLKELVSSLDLEQAREADENELKLVVTSVTGLNPDEIKKDNIEGIGDEAMGHGKAALMASTSDFNKIRGALIFCKPQGLKTELSISDFEPETIKGLKGKIDLLYTEIKAQQSRTDDVHPRYKATLDTLYSSLTKFFPDNKTVVSLNGADKSSAEVPAPPTRRAGLNPHLLEQLGKGKNLESTEASVERQSPSPAASVLLKQIKNKDFKSSLKAVRNRAEEAAPTKGDNPDEVNKRPQ